MRIKLIVSAFICLLLCYRAEAQNGAPLAISDSGTHHYITQTVMVAGASKSMLYQRMKGWVTDALNPSDSYLVWDDANNDSVATIAYLTFDDGNGLINQFFSFKAALRFRDGEVTLTATDVIYNGIAKTTGEEYDLRLNKLGRRLGDNNNQYIRATFDEVWNQLTASFQAAAGR